MKLHVLMSRPTYTGLPKTSIYARPTTSEMRAGLTSYNNWMLLFAFARRMVTASNAPNFIAPV